LHASKPQQIAPVDHRSGIEGNLLTAADQLDEDDTASVPFRQHR
jgi:hypothetical protein